MVQVQQADPASWAWSASHNLAPPVMKFEHCIVSFLEDVSSVVVVAFQIAFRVEIHANDFFYFLKIIFDISTSKWSKKYKPYSILKKKN